MFERFTDEARYVVVTAQEEARALRAPEIEPAHLLLALTEDDGRGGQALRAAGADHAAVRSALAGGGAAMDAEALAALGIDLAQVRAAAEAAFGPGALDRGAGRSGHIPFADGSKRALEEALRAVLRSRLRRRDRVIDSGAVLAGLLAVGDPVVDRVLQQAGTDPAAVRTHLEGTAARGRRDPA